MSRTRQRDRKGSLLVKGGKRKFWLSQWPEGNKRRSKKLGWCDEMTQSQAERAHRKHMEKVNSQRDAAGDSITLESFFRQFYWDQEAEAPQGELVTKKDSTRCDMKNVLQRVWLQRFGKRMMNSLKTSEIQSFLTSRVGEGPGKVSRATAIKWKCYLSSFFSAALRLEVGVTRNPCGGVKLPPSGPEKVPQFLTPEQMITVLSVIQMPVDKMAWQLAAWAGFRRGELRGLRWLAVDWEHNAIFVVESVWEGHSTSPKSRRGHRKVVLTADQMKVLFEYKAKHFPNAGPEDWVLPGKRKRPVDLDWAINHRIVPAAEKVGISLSGWHPVRHMNNSIMLDSNVDIATRRQRLGHTTDEVNLLYSHAGNATQAAASELIQKRLEEAQEKVAAEEQKKVEKGGRPRPRSGLSVPLSVPGPARVM